MFDSLGSYPFCLSCHTHLVSWLFIPELLFVVFFYITVFAGYRLQRGARNGVAWWWGWAGASVWCLYEGMCSMFFFFPFRRGRSRIREIWKLEKEGKFGKEGRGEADFACILEIFPRKPELHWAALPCCALLLALVRHIPVAAGAEGGGVSCAGWLVSVYSIHPSTRLLSVVLLTHSSRPSSSSIRLNTF